MSVALTRFSNRPGIHNPCSKNSVNKDLKVLKKKQMLHYSLSLKIYKNQ